MKTILEDDYHYIIDHIPWKFCEGRTFFITGATGFLAGYIIDLLMHMNKSVFKKSCSIIASCRNREKAEKRFKEYIKYNKIFKIYVQNITEPVKIHDKIDYIIHAASSTATKDFPKVPVDILNANIMGTYNLLNLAKEKKVSRFMFLSSGAVYGDVLDTVNEMQEYETYNYNYYNNENCYITGKRTGEAYCLAYNKQYNVPTLVVRIAHTYGPGINLYDGHVYSDFILNILHEKNLEIKGDGNAYRPFCYVSDAIIAFFLVLFYGQSGEVYNMANTSETWTIWELANLLVKEGFPDINLKIVAPNLILNERPKKILSTDKLMMLGWEPKIGVVKGFRRTAEYYKTKI